MKDLAARVLRRFVDSSQKETPARVLRRFAESSKKEALAALALVKAHVKSAEQVRDVRLIGGPGSFAVNVRVAGSHGRLGLPERLGAVRITIETEDDNVQEVRTKDDKSSRRPTRWQA